MKKRNLAAITAMVLTGALLAGCSSGTAATNAPQTTQAAKDAAENTSGSSGAGFRRVF